MFISLDWISDFVNLDGLDAETIAHRLTMATAEAEGIEVVQRYVDGVVVGEVASVAPAGDNKLVTLNLGRVQATTVCGAPNVRVGLKVAFAPAGTTLADDVVVQAIEKEGVKSEGVICSAKELGMSEWHEIALECPREIDPGTPLSDLITATDHLIEIDNKSVTHRPDLWGQFGFAREIAAIFERTLRTPAGMDLSAYDELPDVDITIDSDLCGCYTAIRFAAETDIPASLTVQRRLHALGQRTHALMVDLTNYAMLELGQPTHAFDGTKVKSIRVAASGEGRKFTPIDGQPRDILPDDLLIWNQLEPVALAGVMGGQDAEISDRTTEVLLESANFSGERVRRTAVRLDLRTEASRRFEKNLPPAISLWATQRILELVQQAGALQEVHSKFSVSGDLALETRYLDVPAGFFSERAGAEIPADRSTEILESLGMSVDVQTAGTIRVGIPPHRSVRDMGIVEDVLEEVLRVYGYDNIPPQVPRRDVSIVPLDEPIETAHRVRRVLTTAHRFHEVHTYGWFDNDWIRAIDYAPARPLELANPSAEQNSIMRDSLLPNLLRLVKRNATHSEAFNLLEIGSVFSADADGATQQSMAFGGVVYHRGKAKKQRQPLLDQTKQALLDLGKALHKEITFAAAGECVIPWQCAGLCATVLADGQAVGSVGVLDGEIATAVQNKGVTAYFELDADALVTACFGETTYVPMGAYQGSTHDFSLVWPLAKGQAELVSILDTISHPLVVGREYRGYFHGQGLEDGMGSYTFRYALQSPERTLTAEDIDGFRDAYIAELAKHDIALR